MQTSVTATTHRNLLDHFPFWTYTEEKKQFTIKKLVHELIDEGSWTFEEQDLLSMRSLRISSNLSFPISRCRFYASWSALKSGSAVPGMGHVIRNSAQVALEPCVIQLLNCFSFRRYSLTICVTKSWLTSITIWLVWTSIKFNMVCVLQFSLVSICVSISVRDGTIDFRSQKARSCIPQFTPPACPRIVFWSSQAILK